MTCVAAAWGVVLYARASRGWRRGSRSGGRSAPCRRPHEARDESHGERVGPTPTPSQDPPPSAGSTHHGLCQLSKKVHRTLIVENRDSIIVIHRVRRDGDWPLDQATLSHTRQPLARTYDTDTRHARHREFVVSRATGARVVRKSRTHAPPPHTHCTPHRPAAPLYTRLTVCLLDGSESNGRHLSTASWRRYTCPRLRPRQSDLMLR